MLENVNLQKEQGTKHCSLTQADCQESRGLVTDGLFFFLIPIQRDTDKNRDLGKCVFSFFPEPQAHVSSGLSVTVPLGQGNLCPGFAQPICWSIFESFMPRLA